MMAVMSSWTVVFDLVDGLGKDISFGASVMFNGIGFADASADIQIIGVYNSRVSVYESTTSATHNANVENIVEISKALAMVGFGLVGTTEVARNVLEARKLRIGMPGVHRRRCLWFLMLCECYHAVLIKCRAN